ncbi:MAG: 2OG-Fe(II) oxygenase family protein [Actinomycetota bacterium]
MSTETTVSSAADPVVIIDGHVPVIDISSSIGGDLAARRVVADAIARACETSGFFVIAGHGVPAALVDEMERVSLDFFALPDETKQAYAVATGDPTIRGWYATPSYVAASNDVETAPDLCELYTVCRLGEPGVATVESLGADSYDVWSRANPWPGEVGGFKDIWLDYYARLEAISAHLMRLFALGLGLDEAFFDDKIDDHITNLVVNYYPPVEGEPLEGQYRKGPHSDWGTLTVLYQDETGGLEVLDRDADEWVPVPVVPGSFVVNVGDLMEVWTNDRWRSTKHRVPVPPAEHRTVPRVSMPYFHQPNWLAEVECLPSCLPAGETPIHEPVTSGQYLLDKIRTTYA